MVRSCLELTDDGRQGVRLVHAHLGSTVGHTTRPDRTRVDRLDRRVFPLLLMLAGAGIPFDRSTAAAAEAVVGPHFASTADSAFTPDSVAADSLSAPDSAPPPGSAAARDSASPPDTASPPDSLSAPDSAKIVLVQFALQNFDQVRVFTDVRRFFGHRAAASSQGILLRRVSWGPSISSYPNDRMVPWPKIESIQVRRGATGAGLLVGIGIGLVVGTAITYAEALGSFAGQPVQDDRPMAWAFAVGGLIGWLVDHPGRWQAVYP
jgi:hypothetical protein